MNHNLVDHIAATIRRVDGGHTMGAGALAEAIVANLPKPDHDDAVAKAADALFAEYCGLTYDGSQLRHRDFVDIARIVLRSQAED